MTTSPTRISLFGSASAERDGRVVDLGARKQRAVLAVLALAQGDVVPVEALIDRIWGEDPPASAKNAVQVYVRGLRQALGDHAIRTTDVGYSLDRACQVDIAEFERAVAEGAYDDALALWTAAPLSDLDGNAWAESSVARLEELRLQALEAQVDAELARGDEADAILRLERAVAETPYRESLWRQLMLGLYRSGRQADALEAFQRVRQVLDEDLGIEPGPALVALVRAVLMQDPGLDRPEEETFETAPLPVPTTPTVGREEAIERLTGLVTMQRLTTLTGMGGVGKTRLALEVARASAPAFDGGAVFVDLSTIRETPAFHAELARAVGAESESDDLDAVCAALAGRHLLLVLDNTEQLAAAPATITRLLSETERVHLLVTTRVALQLVAEHLVPVAALEDADARALLGARIAAATGDPPDHGVIDELAARLHGHPLTIELAAAGCRTLSPTAVLERLTAQLDLPAAPGDIPERQQTVRATMQWSLDLLEADERELLRALGVFRSPFTAEDATTLLGRDVVEPLSRLVVASLVDRQPDGYRVVQQLRDFLDSSGNADGQKAADRHAAWAGQLCRWGSVEMYGADGAAVRTRLIAALPDLRAAYEHLLARGRPDEAARLVLDVVTIWFHAGRLHEAESRLQRVLEAPDGELEPSTRAEATAYRGVFAKMTRAEGSEWMEQGVAGLRELAPDSMALVNTLCHLADLRLTESRPDEAVALADEAVAAARRTDDQGAVAMALDLSAWVAQSVGDRDRAVDAARAAVALARQTPGASLAEALGRLADSLGPDDPESSAVAWEAIALADADDIAPNQRFSVIRTVAAVIGVDAPAETAMLLAEDIAHDLAMGAFADVVSSSTALAGLLETADPTAAATLLGAASRRSTAADPDTKELTERLRGRLGASAFGRATGQGAALDDDALSRLAHDAAAGLDKA